MEKSVGSDRTLRNVSRHALAEMDDVGHCRISLACFSRCIHEIRREWNREERITCQTTTVRMTT